MRSLVSPNIDSLKPYAAGKPPEELARERGIQDAIKLASNENPYGASPKALEAVAQAIAGLHRYPDARAFALRHRLAEHLRAQTGVSVTPEELVFGNGSNELIELILSTFTVAGDHVVFAEPSFVVYGTSALAHHLSSTAVPLNRHRHDLPAMLAALTEHTRVVFIANPNNPTGTYVSKDELERFLRALPPQVIAVIDEAYAEYCTADDYPSALELHGVHERLVVLRTFSKAYGLAGLRLGYAVLPAEMADYLDRVRPPFNANALAQVAAIAALDDPEHLARCRRLNAEQRERVTQELRALGGVVSTRLEVVPSQANFVWVLFDRAAEPLCEALENSGVITRCVPPRGNALRITIGKPEENTRMLEAMKGVLQAHGGEALGDVSREAAR